jgi:hypothetical protein
MGCCGGKKKTSPIKRLVPKKVVQTIKGRPVYLLKKRTSK